MRAHAFCLFCFHFLPFIYIHPVSSAIISIVKTFTPISKKQGIIAVTLTRTWPSTLFPGFQRRCFTSTVMTLQSSRDKPMKMTAQKVTRLVARMAMRCSESAHIVSPYLIRVGLLGVFFRGRWARYSGEGSRVKWQRIATWFSEPSRRMCWRPTGDRYSWQAVPGRRWYAKSRVGITINCRAWNTIKSQDGNIAWSGLRLGTNT